MSTIKIERTHQLSLQEATKRAKTVSDEIAQSYGVKAQWVDDQTVKIDGKGVRGHLNIFANKVVLEIKLSFALRIFAKQIEKGVSKRLERVLQDKTQSS